MTSKWFQLAGAWALLFIAGTLTGALHAQAVPGGVYVWDVPEAVDDVTFEGRPVMRIGATAFVGIPIGRKPGPAQLKFRHNELVQTHEFTVVDKTYTEQHLTIANQAMVDPPAETLERIREESKRQRALYATFADSADLSNGFQLPLEGITTSLFGHRRFLNGKPRSPHSGLDIAADTGTPVHAAGDAVITLADELYFNGNTLFLDHGQGLITMYCHLSELLVEVGEHVRQGQPIGLVGATGRVTGPHLHWSVSLNGNRVDPTVFMRVFNARMISAPAAGVSSAEGR